MKLSLIIPAYNEEKYIGACLEHALKNSNGKFSEIIVIDNASTDRTKEVAEKYPSVRVIREDQKGLTKARQRGFVESTGDILAYIDADTHMPEKWIEILENNFNKNPDCACLSGPYVYYDVSKFKQLLVKFYWYIGMPIYLLTGYMVIGGNFVIRKDVLEKMNGFDTNIKFYGEDTDIGRRANKFGKIKFNPRFYMYTSARRLNDQGFFSTGYTYVINFFSEVFLHKPATEDYKDIR